jgi:hypothetical protein
MPQEFPKDGYLTADERLNRINEIWDDFLTEFRVVRDATLRDANRTVSVSDDYYPSQNDVTIDCNTSGGDVTVFLAPNPIDGQTHTVTKGTAGNQIIVNGNGHNINGSATHSMSGHYKSHIYRYLGGTTQWRIIASS